MAQTHGRAATDRPARYLKQLVQHFGHKTTAEFDDEHGAVSFPFGSAELSTAPDALVITVTADDEEKLSMVREVIARHAERFGAKDGLTVIWQPEQTAA